MSREGSVPPLHLRRAPQQLSYETAAVIAQPPSFLPLGGLHDGLGTLAGFGGRQRRVVLREQSLQKPQPSAVDAAVVDYLTRIQVESMAIQVFCAEKIERKRESRT